MTRAEAVRYGNIVSTQWNGEKSTGCYLGNGRFGAILSGLGLNLDPETQKDPRFSQSHFNHMNHWGRFNFFSPHVQADSSADYILSLYKLYWADAFDNITDYRQCHDLYDGVLTTDFCASNTHYKVTAWFDCVNRDLAGIMIDTDETQTTSKKICFSAPTAVDPSDYVCRRKFAQAIAVSQVGKEWCVSITCVDAVNDSRAAVWLSTNMDAEVSGSDVIFSLKPGKNHLLMSVDAPVGSEMPEVSLARTREWWHKTWQELGWIELPDEKMQKVFIRGMAYMLSAYDADCKMFQPTNCMGVGGFAINFVPDMENIAPALLMTGQQDIVKHWVELFHSRIEEMRKYAKHLWPDAKGIFPPWELNYGPVDGYHSPNVHIIFCYEAHNTGYLCRMAMEAAEFANDENWAKTYAYPLIRECAEFFRTFCFKEADGLWHLRWYPCMGRDEAGGVNKDDYLCTLIAAKYTFQSAIKCGLDADTDYQQILSEGLAFDSLLSDRGTWYTCRNADDFGIQKHPVQLEGLTGFPTEPAPHPAEAEAHRLRLDITEDARIPRFYGWTLAQLLIADTNMKDYAQWAYDWSLIEPSGYVDKDWTQFYETSDAVHMPFYLATHGMITQSLIRNCVNDYWGKVDLASCLPQNAAIRFENIRTRLGVSLTGKAENGFFTGTVTALRNCSVTIGHEQLTMIRGETRALTLSLSGN